MGFMFKNRLWARLLPEMYNVREKTGLKYKSDKWKKIYANRTSCERLNNRILNDYNLHKSKMGTERRLAFQTFLACVNIHVDAWSKTGK